MNRSARKIAIVAGVIIAASTSLAPAAAGSAPAAGLHPGRLTFLAPSPVRGPIPGGPSTVTRPDCKPGQIESAAFTQTSPDGVLGVVELKGTKMFHEKAPLKGKLRCGLPFEHGPRGFLGADGQPLDVPLGQADLVNPAENIFSWINLEDGKAAWGFGWFGTYCGPAPRYVVMKLYRKGGTVNVPYDGPTPICPTDPGATVSSMLSDGPSGASTSPVAPAPPSYLSLTTSATFLGTTTHKAPAPVEVTISDTSDQPVAVDPCLFYEIRTVVAKHLRSTSIGGRTPGCRKADLTVTPSQPVTFTVSPQDLSVGSPFGAPKGSTFTVHIDLAGMPTATATTTVTSRAEQPHVVRR